MGRRRRLVTGAVVVSLWIPLDVRRRPCAPVTRLRRRSGGPRGPIVGMVPRRPWRLTLGRPATRKPNRPARLVACPAVLPPRRFRSLPALPRPALTLPAIALANRIISYHSCAALMLSFVKCRNRRRGALIATTTGAEARCTAFAAPCRSPLVPPARRRAADGAWPPTGRPRRRPARLRRPPRSGRPSVTTSTRPPLPSPARVRRAWSIRRQGRRALSAR